MLLVQLLNVALNLVLKRAIQQPRPAMPGAEQLGDSGMPSNHAQFMGCFAVLLLFALWGNSPRARGGAALHRLPLWVRALLSAGVLVLAALCAVSRVYLGYHSAQQVGVGLLVGSAFAAAAHDAAVGSPIAEEVVTVVVTNGSTLGEESAGAG